MHMRTRKRLATPLLYGRNATLNALAAYLSYTKIGKKLIFK